MGSPPSVFELTRVLVSQKVAGIILAEGLLEIFSVNEIYGLAAKQNRSLVTHANSCVLLSAKLNKQ